MFYNNDYSIHSKIKNYNLELRTTYIWKVPFKSVFNFVYLDIYEYNEFLLISVE